MKINPEFGVPDELLLSCNTADSVTCSNSRVSLSRGNAPGYEFVFTLSNTSRIRDAGQYRVNVQTIDPVTNIYDQITKTYSLEGS